MTDGTCSNDLARTYYDDFCKSLGPAWQHVRTEEIAALDVPLTPPLEDLAAHPGASLTLYQVTYRRVGRTGSPLPPPYTVWALSANHLAEQVTENVAPYISSWDVTVTVDLESLSGRIFCGLRVGGHFSIEQLTQQPS